MRRSVSTSTRVLRALTGLLTVWCLGCSAFDPMLSELLPSSAVVMDCAFGGDMKVPGSPDGGQQSAPQLTTSLADQAPAVGAPNQAGGMKGFDCGCQSCTAPSPAAPNPTVTSVATAMAPVLAPLALRSFEREPLVPPPQRSL